MTTDHCPADRIARELTEHRDACAVEWSARRSSLSFAVIVAKRACPEWKPTSPDRAEQEER